MEAEIDYDTIKLSKARDPNDLITLIEADMYGITEDDVQNYKVKTSPNKNYGTPGSTEKMLDSNVNTMPSKVQYFNVQQENSTSGDRDEIKPTKLNIQAIPRGYDKGEYIPRTTDRESIEIVDSYAYAYRGMLWKQRTVEIKATPIIQVLVKRNLHVIEKMLGKKFRKWVCTVQDATWLAPDYRLIIEFNNLERAVIAIINERVVRANVVDFKYVMTKENSRVPV